MYAKWGAMINKNSDVWNQRAHGATATATGAATGTARRASLVARPSSRARRMVDASSAVTSTSGGGGRGGAGEENGASVGTRARARRRRASVDSSSKREDMPPPRWTTRARRGPSRETATVLDEDEYTARLEAIIERDYFPDLRSNRLKAALLEATRAGDAAAMAEIHGEMARERIARVGSRGGVVGTPSIGGSGTTSAAAGDDESWETETPRRRTRDEFDRDEKYDEECDREGGGTSLAYDQDRHLSVDGFLAQYTSEDNAAFSEIVARTDARRELKKRHLEAITAPPSRRLALAAELKASDSSALVPHTSESDTSSGKALTTVGHDSIYNSPQGLALSVKERQQMVVGEPKETVAKNTRFVPPKAPNLDGKGGKTPQTKQYERVHTPNFTPGVDASPLMTWGEIASTPLRLEDTASDPSAGKFTLKQSSVREKKLRELTSKNSRASATPTPRTRRGAPTPNGLSSAAKSLLRRVTPARRATTPRGDLDAALRKSYSGRTPKASSVRCSTAPKGEDGGGGLLRLD